MSSSARYSNHSGTGADRHVRHSITDDIDALIGDYNAWQTESEARERGRRGSAGTLVVDWDGSGYGQAFYRGRNSSPIHLAEGSGTASSAVSRATTSKTSRVPSSATSRATSSAAPRATTSRLPRTQPAYTASTVSSSAKSKQHQSIPKPRHDSLFSNSNVSTAQSRYADTEHFRCKPPKRTDSTDVNFHRDPVAGAGADTYGHADITVAYSPTTNTARGHDPATHLNYAYNGSTMYVHEQPQRRHHLSGAPTGKGPHTPPLNAYFSIPIEKYRPTTHTTSTTPSSSAHIKLQQHKSLPPLPSHKKRTVKSFVKRVLSKLDSSGVLGKMRQEREEMRKTEAWMREGYFA